jgi:multidrug efflux pump subunit AcrA (membrane-fusion protein)
MTVSRDAINRYPDGRVTVWLAESAGDDLYEVREKRVEVGSGFDNRMEILSGLEGDEQVVIRGNESLENGAKVKLAERGSR